MLKNVRKDVRVGIRSHSFPVLSISSKQKTLIFFIFILMLPAANELNSLETYSRILRQFSAPNKPWYKTSPT